MKEDNEFWCLTKDVERVGAVDRSRGKSLFSDDIALKDPLILKVFRSERVHAKLEKIDIEKAATLPGVLGVLSAEDIPGRNRFGLIKKDQPVLADQKIRFAGEAVALVVAENERAAEDALGKIRVTYRDLPPVFDPDKALEDDAPAIHEKGNLLFRKRIEKGDTTEGLARSHVVIRRSYRTPHLEHSYMEPDAGAGYVDKDGTFVIWASTQNPHYDRKEVAEILGLDEGFVRIIPAATGGGFGSKLDLGVQGFIGLALHHFRRPVKLVYSREESYLATSKRHPFMIRMENGVDKDGRLLAMRCRLICDTGAYASYGIAVATRAAVHATGPYEIENVDIESMAVYTNNPVAGAMRGFGVPQVAFAHESQMDLLARELGMDPIEIRRVNALRPGSRTATGQLLEKSIGLSQTLEAVESHYRSLVQEWKENCPEPNLKRGIGVGAMWYGIGNTGVRNPSAARIEMDRNGKITLFTGAAEIGQGSSTVLKQIATEILKTDPKEIEVVAGDTKRTSNAGATSASRQTYISGNAVKEAAEKMADHLMTAAEEALDTPRSLLFFQDGAVINSVDPERRIPFGELARRLGLKEKPLRCQGWFDPETTPLDPSTGQGVPYATYAFACHLALVEVDSSSGQVRVGKIVAAHDVGKAIHPLNVEGQIQGGVGMGLGFALLEKYIPGKTLSLAEYSIPTASDMPTIVPIIIEDSEPTGPFGAKGVGEPALIPTAPAILNAIADAVGERVYELPAGPEKVKEAMGEGNPT